jgi:hypothetical protein
LDLVLICYLGFGAWNLLFGSWCLLSMCEKNNTLSLRKKDNAYMNDIENYIYESERPGDNKPALLLIAGLILAAAITIWIIFSFNKESRPPDHIGQQEIKQIMVANLSNSGNYIL